MPISLLFFAVTAFVFLLQLIPVIGIFLMFLMAPFWSIFLVNAGFIGVGLEVWFGRIHPIWAAAPLLWFGGYFGASLMADREIDALSRSFVAETRLPGAGFVPDKDALLIENRHYSTWFIAPELVHGYALRTAFQSERKTADRNIVAVNLGDAETCAELRKDFSRNHLIDTHIVAREAETPQSGSSGTCAYSSKVPVPKAPFRISAAKTEGTMFLAPYERFDITVTAPDGRQARKSALRITRLAAFPLPIIGCALISAGPSWSCSVKFWSTNAVQLGMGGGDLERRIDQQKALPFVVAALGLKPSPQEGRFTPLPEFAAMVLKNKLDGVHVQSLATIETLLANAESRSAAAPPVFDVHALAAVPHLWRHRLDAMTDAFVTHLGKPDAPRLVNDFAALFARLPAEDLARIGPKLVEAFRAKANKECLVSGMFVMRRLGDLGSVAMPAFRAWADAFRDILKTRGDSFPHHNVCLDVMLGICRAGPAAVPVLDHVERVYLNTRRFHSTHDNAHRALLRMGRADIAAKDEPINKPDVDARYARERQSITPQSPRSACYSGPGQDPLPP